MTKQTVELGRLGPTFHRTFSLIRPAVSQVLDIASDVESLDKNTAFDRLREGTNLGTIYVAAMPRYAVGAGLLEDKTNRLTPLGEAVLAHDPDLNHPATLWLMHYHLSAPKGPGPSFWHYLVSRELHVGESFTAAALAEKVRAFLQQEDVSLVDRSLRTLVTVFTGTYSKSDGLSRLGILPERDEVSEKSKKGREESLEILEPDAPPVYALGYALAHFWEQQVGALRTDLSSLSAPGGFAGLFFISMYGLNSALRELQREGYVELEQIAPPHQVVRRWEGKEVFLERLYE